MRARFVVDARNNSVQGPFRKGEAEKLAKRMNEFLCPPIFKNAVVTGPFYPRTGKRLTATQRAEVVRLYHS